MLFAKTQNKSPRTIRTYVPFKPCSKTWNPTFGRSNDAKLEKDANLQNAISKTTKRFWQTTWQWIAKPKHFKCMSIGTNDAVSQTRKKQSWMGTASLWCPYWFNSRVWGIRLHWSVTCLLVASYNTSFVNHSIYVATVFAIPAIWPDLSLRGTQV